MSTDLLRLYDSHECGTDGYPFAWRRGEPRIPDLVRELGGHRCARCLHPYRTKQSRPEWSLCDERCRHVGPLRIIGAGDNPNLIHVERPDITSEQARTAAAGILLPYNPRIEAQWRVLTVHHLTGEKADCRWWNIPPLCQRCHLYIQGRVKMEQVYPFEHSAWFRPYAAGYYAMVYLGEDLTREEVEERQDELLSLELAA